MKRILITAPTGMLGSMVYNVFKNDYELVLVYRDKSKLELLDKSYGKVGKHIAIQFDLLDLAEDYRKGFIKNTIGESARELLRKIGKVDAVINCAGIIKPYMQEYYKEALIMNGAIPRILGYYFREKLIHLTTDCVFNGIEGAPYSESSFHSYNDMYGLSKSMGEPASTSLVFRTSIIGPEIAGFVSLLEWVKKQNNKEVIGYVNHFWNGITTKEFARICRDVIEKRDMFPEKGIFHLFSTDVSKYEMVKLIAEKYKVSLHLKPEVVWPIDRRLTSIYDVVKKLHIPSFQDMLDSL